MFARSSAGVMTSTWPTPSSEAGLRCSGVDGHIDVDGFSALFSSTMIGPGIGSVRTGWVRIGVIVGVVCFRSTPCNRDPRLYWSLQLGFLQFNV